MQKLFDKLTQSSPMSMSEIQSAFPHINKRSVQRGIERLLSGKYIERKQGMLAARPEAKMPPDNRGYWRNAA